MTYCAASIHFYGCIFASMFSFYQYKNHKSSSDSKTFNADLSGLNMTHVWTLVTSTSSNHPGARLRQSVSRATPSIYCHGCFGSRPTESRALVWLVDSTQAASNVKDQQVRRPSGSTNQSSRIGMKHWSDHCFHWVSTWTHQQWDVDVIVIMIIPANLGTLSILMKGSFSQSCFSLVRFLLDWLTVWTRNWLTDCLCEPDTLTDWLTAGVIAPASLPGHVWHAVITSSYY